MMLIYWKYKSNKLLQLRMISKIYIYCNIWLSKFTPTKMKFTPG